MIWVGQSARVAFPGNDRVHHGPARHAVDIGGHQGQLHAGVLEKLLDTVLLSGAHVDQVRAVAGEVPQSSDRWWWHEAGPEHLPFGDLAQPHRVEGGVGLGASGQVLDILGVDQPRIQTVGFEDVEDRFPVVAGRFHHDPLDTQVDEPLGQVGQRTDHGGVGRDLLQPTFPSSRGWQPHTADDFVLRDIQRCDPLDDLLVIFRLAQRHLPPSRVMSLQKQATTRGNDQGRKRN